MVEPSLDAVEQALYVERSLVRHHAFRRTLWVMAPHVAKAAHASATMKISAVERRALLRMVADCDGIAATTIEDAAAWCSEALGLVRSSIRTEGPSPTRQLGQRFPELTVPLTLGAGTKHAGQAAAHTKLLQLAGFEADLVRTIPSNGWNTAEYAWGLTEDWLGQPLTGAALRESAALVLSLWLDRFGPATDVDIRWWTGWTAAQTNGALADIEAEPVLLQSGQPAWISAGDVGVEDVGPSVALLPGLDATTMGWKERTWYVSDEAASRTFDRWSNAGPTIWLNGEVVGGWVQRADGSVATELYVSLTDTERRMLDGEIDRFIHLVGDTRVRLRFPARNQKELMVSG